MKRYIYLILNEDNGHIKVGIGKNPSKRVKQLQTGSSAKLTVIYKRLVEKASVIEKNIHADYHLFRISGEWFDIPNLSIDKIDKSITLYENNVKCLEDLENPFFK